jgi:hypothetical protein
MILDHSQFSFEPVCWKTQLLAAAVKSWQKLTCAADYNSLNADWHFTVHKQDILTQRLLGCCGCDLFSRDKQWLNAIQSEY